MRSLGSGFGFPERTQALPRVEILWTERELELESLAELAAAGPKPPTEALIRALRA